jgi:hypothetical protein
MNAKEKVKAWKAAKQKDGWRHMSLSVDYETARKIDEIRQTLSLSKGGKNKPVIVAAIRHLHQSIFNK